MNLHNITSAEQELYLQFCRYNWTNLNWQTHGTRYQYSGVEGVWRTMTAGDQASVRSAYLRWLNLPEPRPITRNQGY